MRKFLIILALMLVPTAVWAQGGLRVLSVHGPVEWKKASGRLFAPVNATTQQLIQVGDQLHTGADAEIILQVPDGSYMVVSENSKLTVEDFWSGNLKSIMNLMVGRVRFYIEKLGGKPNPYSVTTPTALIAVRGTIFDVIVDQSENTAVACLDGRVTVQNIMLGSREVILNPGLKTLVRPNEVPTMPSGELDTIRKIAIQKKSAPSTDGTSGPFIDTLVRDNDRGNRPNSPQNGSNSTTGADNPQRAKPTLTFP